MLHRRLFSTKFLPRQIPTPAATADVESAGTQNRKWRIKQVTRSNFNESLDEVKTRIFDADFIAISLQNTGAFSAPWQRLSSFDIPDTAYSKARRAAERFQVLQFAVCPFSLNGSNLTAYPYNFQLFPRDELKLGMPSYSFSCQISFLSSMARLGFDFNSCIYDGISYLSREQESVAKYQLGNAFLAADAIVSSSSKASSVGDSVFVERIKRRVRNWREACTDQDPLMRSLRKLVAGSENYGSRPSMDIDVCSERQVHLSLEVLKQFSDDVVPLIVPSRSGGTQAVRIVLTSSKEDKALFEAETRDAEEQQRKHIRGFREVIDLISASEKPIVSHNSLDDFSFIHSKFIGPLPPSMSEFEQSVRSLFSCVLDLNHLMAEVTPQSNMTNIPAALAYMRNRFFAPIDIKIPHLGSSAEVCEGKVYGHNVIRISHLFAKICYVLQQNRSKLEANERDRGFDIRHHATFFSRGHIDSIDSLSDEDVQVSQGKKRSTRKLSSKDLVFLWGFEQGISAGKLKSLLTGSHTTLSEEDLFDVKLVDKSCAMLAFWRSGLSVDFIEATSSGGVGYEGLGELISEGLKAANYEGYRRACGMEIWESCLGDLLDRAVSVSCAAGDGSEVNERSAFEIFWDNEVAVNLEDE